MPHGTSSRAVGSSRPEYINLGTSATWRLGVCTSQHGVAQKEPCQTCTPVSWVWRFFLLSGNSKASDLRWHPERLEGEISERCHWPQPRPAETEQVNCHSERASEGWQPPQRKSKADFPEQSSLPLPSQASVSSPTTQVFKELGQLKVGHMLEPKGKLSRPQLPCSQPEDNADSPGGQVASETCPTILGILVTPSHLLSEKNGVWRWLWKPPSYVGHCSAFPNESVSIATLRLRPSSRVEGEQFTTLNLFYSSVFIHLAMTHRKKYISYHNTAHPYMCKHIYLYVTWETVVLCLKHLPSLLAVIYSYFLCYFLF